MPPRLWRHTLPDRDHPEAARFRSAFEILRTLNLFAPVSDGELLKFSALGFERRVERDNAVIPGAGRYDPPLALLLEGEAVLAWGRGLEELFLQGLEPGDLIGEAELFDAIPYSKFKEKPEANFEAGFEGGPALPVGQDRMIVRDSGDEGGAYGHGVAAGRADSANSANSANSPEDWFGEPRARALTTVRLMEWDRDVVCEALRRWPDVAISLLSGLARRQRTLERRVASLCCLRAPGRLARVLTALLEERGRTLRDDAGRRGVLLLRTPSRLRLSEISGMARETVSRLLTDWERRGWITGYGGDLLVLDGHQLRRLAGTDS